MSVSGAASAGAEGTRGVEGTWRGLLGVGLVAAVLTGCGGGVASGPPDPGGGRAADRKGITASAPVAELVALYEARDFFGLSRALERSAAAQTDPVASYLRAVVEHARNRPARSNEVIGRMLAAGSVPDTLTPMLYRLRYRNHFRRGQYREALESLEAVLAHDGLSAEERGELENEARVLAALAGTPATGVARRGTSRIQRLPNTRVPVLVEGHPRAYVLDTGANLSVLMRSEADSLGLEVRPAGVAVGSSTGGTVVADVAVAGRVAVGEVVLSDVVFLVLPDEALTFSGGRFTIPGILGFPVLEALGEVAFRGSESLEVPARVPMREPWNLALDNLTPLVRVGALGEEVTCDLDTGAGRTTFTHAFYQRHRDHLHAVARPDTLRFAGAGGEVSVEVRVLPEARLAVGDTFLVLSDVPVRVEPLSGREQGHLACTIGLDVVNSFQEYVLNFQSMTFLLR